MIAAVRAFESGMETACDELSLVIKGFHAIEKRIEAALLNALPVPEGIELRRVSFLLKVDILASLGFLRPDQRPLFDKTNAVRNTYAHDPNKIFSDVDQFQLLGSLRAHVPGFKDSEAPNPAESLKCLFTVTYLHSYLALERAVKARAGNYVAGLYVAEVRKKTLSRPLPEVDQEIEKKLREFLGENSPEFNTEEVVYELLNRRKPASSGVT